jgi:NAD(P)-dependent dehydrogenase (short-subunit alcohol dehydrogenase family)
MSIMSFLTLGELLEKMGLSKDDLSEEVAVITGGGQGIGKELSRALAKLGAKVIIAEIADTGRDVENLIKSEGGSAVFIKTDVSNEESMHDLTEKVYQLYGKVDILINNAIIFTIGSVKEQSVENWKRVFNVNLMGAVLGIKHFLPRMLERKHGVIVTITSDEGTAYLAPYSASKVALQSLGYSLANELDEDSGVSVFVFGPGLVDTPGGREAFTKLAPLYKVNFEEFVKLGSTGGFEGMMPVQYSAAGFAYAIAHAQEYHGQIIDPFRPLGVFGLLPSSKDQISNQKDPIRSFSAALEVAIKLKEVMESINKETEELNFFAKKWVQKTYVKRTSLSIQDWLDILNETITIFQNENLEKLLVKYDWLKSILKKLELNFVQSKADAKGYFKDKVKLKDALDVIEYRRKTVENLLHELN